MPITIRKQDVKASNLIFVSLGVSIIQILLYRPYNHFDEPNVLRWLLFSLIGWLTIKVVLAFGIRAGYGWVRILFVLFTVPAIVLGVKDIVTHQEPITKVILPLIAMALQAWAAGIIVKTQFSDYD
jgi:hypothetical protein